MNKTGGSHAKNSKNNAGGKGQNRGGTADKRAYVSYRFKGILVITAVLSMIIAYPQDALFLFFSLYAVSGVIAGIYKALRGLFRGREAAC